MKPGLSARLVVGLLLLWGTFAAVHGVLHADEADHHECAVCVLDSVEDATAETPSVAIDAPKAVETVAGFASETRFAADRRVERTRGPPARIER